MTQSIQALFVPGNMAHVRTQLPVAEALTRRGHAASFLVRDRVVVADYHTAPALRETSHTVHEFAGAYETDVGRVFPAPGAYRRSRVEVDRGLAEIPFDIAVVCNDDSALFDRLVVDFSRRHGRPALLIQESVRPAHRRLSPMTRLRHQGPAAMAADLARALGGALISGPFARRGYARGGCDLIAAAGDRFRRRLITEGVPGDRIRVTGQPRLDTAVAAPPPPSTPGEEAVLLFCSQPIPAPPPLMDRMFTELVAACGAWPGVKLVFKLHPRDLPEAHWRNLLPTGAARDRVEITGTRPLDECFGRADAMMTVASTTALEAMAAGLPVGLLDYLPTTWYLPYEESGAALSIRSRESLTDGVRRLLHDQELRRKLAGNAEAVLLDELHLRDGRSAERIADFIEERLG